MQRVEMAWITTQNLGIEPFSLVELTIIVGAPRAPEPWRQARRRLWHPLAQHQSAQARASRAQGSLTIGKQAW
jgi:hypothetical protein